jgi:predicted nucleic acid-binding protein
MVLEAAVAAGCRYIVTFNKRDFETEQPLPVRLVTPQEFLHTIGVLK